MAKDWNPTEKEKQLWDRLARESNKIRKILLKTRKNEERESPVGSLPALVIPKQQKTGSRINWKALKKKLGRERFRRQLKEFKKLFGKGIKSYLKETYKKGYQLLWQDHIGQKPLGKFGRYSEEQITNADRNIALFMEFYNKINQMSALNFYHMAQLGYLKDFKYIYDNINGKENGALEEQMEMISIYWKRFGKKGAYNDSNLFELSNVYNKRTETRVKNKLKGL